MMNLPERTIDVKCGECGKHFNVTTTRRMGKISVTCIHCHSEQEHTVTPAKIGEKTKEPTNRFDTMIPVRVLGKPVYQGNKYIIEKQAKINKQTCFICPCCNKSIALTPTRTGEQSITCKDCGTKVYITAYDPEEEALRKEREEALRKEREEALRKEREEALRKEREEALRREREEALRKEREEALRREREQYEREEALRKERAEEQRRKQEEDQRMVQYPQDDDSNETVVAKPKRVFTNYILQRGGGFFSKSVRFRLFTGTTIVGRKDSKTPSDIQFDDPEMSRRSVQLDVEMHNGVTTVILTVLKDLNPVLVNGIRVPQGDSVRLISETRIKMGQTELTFKKM